VNKDIIARLLVEMAVAIPLLVLGAICIIFFDDISIFYAVCILFVLAVILFLIYVTFIGDKLPNKVGHIMMEVGDVLQVPIKCTKCISTRKPLHVEVEGKILIEIYRGNEMSIPLPLGKFDFSVYPNPVNTLPQSFDVTPNTSFFMWQDENGINRIVDNDGASMEHSLENRYAQAKKRQKQLLLLFVPIGLAIITFVAYLMVR
jgi:hypothetical protein